MKKNFEQYGIKINVRYIHKRLSERNQFESIFQNKDDVFLFHPTVIKQNITDIQQYFDNYKNIVCLVSHRKPYHHETTKHYPIDEQDAIWKMFRLCYLDDDEINYSEYVIPFDSKYTEITQQQLKRLVIDASMIDKSTIESSTTSL